MARLRIPVVIILAVTVLGAPASACNFDCIPTTGCYCCYDFDGASWSGGATMDTVRHEGETNYPHGEVGVRLSAYKWDNSVLRYVDEDQSLGPVRVYLEKNWQTLWAGCWHLFGYHWCVCHPWLTGSTFSVSCVSRSSDDTCSDSCNSSILSGLLPYAEEFANQAEALDMTWEMVVFEDLDGMKTLLGDKIGGRLAHYLYVSGAHTFILNSGDLMPAVFVSPDRVEAIVVMFQPSVDTAVLFRLSLNGEYMWEVTDGRSYDWRWQQELVAP